MGLGFDLDQDWKILIRLGYGTGNPNRIVIFPIQLEYLTQIFVMELGPDYFLFQHRGSVLIHNNIHVLRQPHEL